jgi:uncharacterized protein
MRAVVTLFLVLGAGGALTPPSGAQNRTSPVVGAWAGWLEVGSNFQPVTVTLSPGVTPPGAMTALLSGVSRPLDSVGVSGSGVQITVADPRFPVLKGTLDRDVISGVAEATGGRRGTFRLMRTAALDVREKRRFVGAYRFADGRFLLVDLGYPQGSDMLYAIDAHTGNVRAMYPVSATTFVSGPALLVPEPTAQTLSFELTRAGVRSVVRRQAGGVPERAMRVALREEEVRFRSGDVNLAGTLLTPATGTRHPGLVFVPSAGQIAREQFWGFGYLMAARGFAVLAFDKRGTGESTGEWRGTTFEQLADDVVAGARFLQSRPEIDKQRIGIWGLSQGAWLAPLAAVQAGDAAFVVTLSGGGLTPAQAELLDSEYGMRVAGLSQADVDEGMTFQRTKNDYLRTGEGWNEYAALLKHATTSPWWRLAGTDLSGPATPDDVYWKHTRPFYFYEPAPVLQRLRAPLLAIFGELDSPDGVKANVVGIARALDVGKGADMTIRVFPNGRHNLMDLEGFGANEYPRLQRFVPELFDTMASWMERRVMR